MEKESGVRCSLTFSLRTRHMTRTFIGTMIVAMALTASLGHAQSNPPPPSEFNADLGFVSVSGNTSITSLTAGQKWIRRIPRWEFLQELGAVYGRTDGEETSNLWRATLRGDYGLGNNLALYGRVGFDRNKFAGVKSRFAEGIGLVARLQATDINQLNVEAGYELTQQDNLDGTNETFSSLRAASNWKHMFSENAYFFQGVEWLPNLDDSEDYRINSETSVVAPLSSHVAMKVSYQLRFDNLPSLNAAGTAPLRKSDRILSTGIQVSF